MSLASPPWFVEVAEERGLTWIRSVSTRNYFFSENDQIVNFDDILDYDELNNLKEKSPFLSCDSLKLLIVIAPLSRFSSLI